MADQKYVVMVVEAGHSPVLSQTDYLSAAILRFCKQIIRMQHRECAITLTEHGETDRTVAAASFDAPKSHRVTGD